LLRVVSELPGGAVILPDLDLSLGKEVWDALGQAGKPAAPGEPPFGPGDAVTHPQYHLKLLLGRMGVAREEVQAWHRAGLAAAPPARSRAISSLFLPPAASARWASLPDEARRLSGVRLMESAHPGEEALAVALLLREALEVPERRVALVTPDRALAARVVAELARWGIEADDTAGQPLPQTRAGRLFLLLAEVMAEGAPPVPLVALLGHPLVRAGEGRAAWLDEVRRLDLALRGPRPDAGLDSLRSKAGADWWAEVEAVLAPLLEGEGEGLLADWIDRLAAAGEALCGDALWSEADGRSLAAFVEELRQAARAIGTRIRAARSGPGGYARRWSACRCARRGAATRALPSTACLKGAWRGRIWWSVRACTKDHGPVRPAPMRCCRLPCCATWACPAAISASACQRTISPGR